MVLARQWFGTVRFASKWPRSQSALGAAARVPCDCGAAVWAGARARNRALRGRGWARPGGGGLSRVTWPAAAGHLAVRTGTRGLVGERSGRQGNLWIVGVLGLHWGAQLPQ